MPPPSDGGVDKKLADSLKRAKKLPADRPYFFALVVKGAAAGKLLVSKKKIPPKEIAEAKKETGGSAVVKGVCYGGSDGEIVFETVKPPAPAWTVLAKKLAKEDAGLAIKPLFTVGRDDEQVAESDAPDEEPGAPPTAEPGAGPAKLTEADWKAKVDAVTARVKAAAAAGNPAARDMVLGISQAGAFFRGGKADEAVARLAEVEALLAAPPPGAPPAPPSAPPADAAKRFSGLAPAVKAALVAKGPNAARIQALAGAVAGLLKNGDAAQANKVLDELEPLLARPTAPPGDTPPAPPPKAPPPPTDPAAEWKAKLAEYTPAIKAALAAKGPNAAEVTKLFAQANALSKPGGDMAQALAKLKECHDLARSGGETPPQAPPAPPPPADAAKRFNGLTAALKAALAAKGPNVTRIQTLAGAVAGLLKNGDAAQANKVLDELEPLLAPPTAPPPGEPPPGAPPPKAPPPPPGSAVQRFNALAGAIKAALAAKGPDVARIQSLVVAVNGLLKNKDFAQAGKVLDELEPLLAAGGTPPTAPPPPQQPEEPARPAASGLAAWQAAREQVVKQIRAVVGKIGALKEPDAVEAVIELRAIIANLTPNPATPQQVAELDRYLRTDDVITDAESIPPDFGTLSIRGPLLAALEQLKS